MSLLKSNPESNLTLNKIQKEAISLFWLMVVSNKIHLLEVKNCWCGSRDLESISQYDRFGLPFGTNLCRSCGLISQNLMIKEEDLELFYKVIYWQLVTGGKRRFTPVKEENLHSLVSKHINNRDDLKILEIGCGTGHRISSLIIKFKQEGINCHGYACDYANELSDLECLRDITFRVGGLDSIRIAGKVDIIIMSHVLEHFTCLDKAIQSIVPFCTDQTLLYIEVPGVLDLKNKKEYNFDYQIYSVLAHNYNFCLTTLSNVMKKHGFNLIEGDEYVRAVFKRSLQNLVSQNAYDQVKESLIKTKYYSEKYQRSIKFVVKRYIKTIIKALLGKPIA